MLPGVKDLKLQEKLRKKYSKYSSFFEKRDMIPPEFSQFAATFLQSNWKRYVVRNAYLKLKEVSILLHYCLCDYIEEN